MLYRPSIMNFVFSFVFETCRMLEKSKVYASSRLHHGGFRVRVCCLLIAGKGLYEEKLSQRKTGKKCTTCPMEMGQN